MFYTLKTSLQSVFFGVKRLSPLRLSGVQNLIDSARYG